MKFNKFDDLEHNLINLFNKFNLLNLWSDSIKLLNSNLNFFLRTEGKNFWIKLKVLISKYDIDINDLSLSLIPDFWNIKIKITTKQKIVFNLKYVKFDFQKEKTKKIISLNKLFLEEISKLQRLKKNIINKKQKVLIYPITNKNHPLFPVSEIIKYECNIYNNFLKSKIDFKKLLIKLNICENQKINEFYNFLFVTDTRFVSQIENEIIPFIENIKFINSRNKILKIYYYDAPDFILINEFDEAIGVEVTNIKHKKNYYEKQGNKMNLLRKMVNPNCYYSKKFFLHKQLQKTFFWQQKNINNLSYKIVSLKRHFANNNKYNDTIRKSGLKVKRGQKNFYILNGWNKNNNILEKKAIKNIANKKNIPCTKLIFSNIDESN